MPKQYLPVIFLLALAACLPPGGEADSPAPLPPLNEETPASAPVSVNPTLPPVAPGEGLHIWVDPASGSDSNNGADSASALQTLDAAWRMIPVGETLNAPVTIHILPGTLSAEQMPNYWESRYGAPGAGITILAENGPGSVTLTGSINMFDVHHLTLQGLHIIPEPAGDVFHCELCQHITVRDSLLAGRDGAHETVKVNQSQYIYLINNDISGAGDNTIDFVAVQYGGISGNRISNAGDWCAYVKGGSAYISVEKNEIFNCGTGGFTAGQGTGFQFMTPPWLQYEAYDIRVVNNIIHDTEGAGLGVNGGYNILMAYNTLYRVGSRSHVIEVVFGLRSCDGQPGDEGRERCQQYLDAGGWGTTAVDDGTNAVQIGNRNVYIFNNIVYNPAGFRSEYQHFAIYGPRSNPGFAALPLAVTDDNLVIRGNIIWNGNAGMPLGIEGEDGCQPGNLTCNGRQLIAENSINTFEPTLVDPANGDFAPAGGWNYPAAVIPGFGWEFPDLQQGFIENLVMTDFFDQVRMENGPPGAVAP